MCSIVMSLLTRCHYNTINGSRLTGLTCSKVPGFWVVEHQLVSTSMHNDLGEDTQTQTHKHAYAWTKSISRNQECAWFILQWRRKVGARAPKLSKGGAEPFQNYF